ncbi:hypothetical protein BH24ACT5_BH24ACT5_16260 [soil metagenome]
MAASAASASAETVSDSTSVNVPLDAPGSGTLDAFDPSLGTLTSVTYSVSTDVLTQVCIENLSQTSGSTTGGPASGTLAVTFPAGITTTSSVDASVPATDLPASNGTDDCLAGFDEEEAVFPGTVSSSDVAFTSLRDPQTATGIITDPAAMAAFIGPGTVPFSWTSASNADINQPSEWDIFFIAAGDLAVSVTYTYTPAGATTTTNVPGATTTTMVPSPTTTPIVTDATTTTTTVSGGELPRTGGPSNQIVVLASSALALGGAVLVARRLRMSRS